MFGFKYVKVPPTSFLIKYSGGKIKKEGTGVSCFYYAPATTLVSVPVGTIDQMFIFEEVTKDYQEITIQGQFTFQINDPKQIASQLDFSLDNSGTQYATDDPEKLPQRIVNIVKVLTRSELKELGLRDAVFASEIIREKVTLNLEQNLELKELGVSVIGLSILAIKANPETTRALESETKENILRKADEAIFMRRNAAVEQERTIKENELNTEIAVEEKKRQIRETQMDAERAVQEKEHQMQQSDMLAKIGLENEKKKLVSLESENNRNIADTKAYAMEVMLKTLSHLDPRVLQLIASAGMSPEQMISQAFQGLAENANKIGNLNISPEMLTELLTKRQ
jgi:hypothetical protein